LSFRSKFPYQKLTWNKKQSIKNHARFKVARLWLYENFEATTAPIVDCHPVWNSQDIKINNLQKIRHSILNTSVIQF